MGTDNSMRFLLYNIRYATAKRRPLFPWSGYLSRTNRHLEKIIDFVGPLEPDVVGLVEVDSGSFRTGRRNQAETMADALGHYHTFQSKYCQTTRVSTLPLLKQQGNAFLAKDTITNEKFHYFGRGVKRLVIELELNNLVIFLVHLALGFRVRHRQLGELYSLVKGTEKPHIVAGDFNALWGENEIGLFLGATGLINANRESRPSFPSWAPARHLDFILHSPEIEARQFSMPDVTFSDHLPLLFDFELPRG